ncbi:MAG: hypothetical protein AB7G37_05520 [Solirubrobacteraceae bacterium]
MTSTHDAFGRRADGTADRSAARVEQPSSLSLPPRRDGRRTVARMLQLVLVVVGVGGVYGTMRVAADIGPDQPQAIAFALGKDPFGARSLVTAGPLRDALRRAEDARHDDEIAVGVSVDPDRVTVTVLDPRDQQRSIRVDAAGDVRTTDLGSGGARPSVAIDLSRLDVDVPANAIRERHRAFLPHGHDPQFSLLTDSGTGAARGWVLNLDGIRRDDRTRVIDLRGGAT